MPRSTTSNVLKTMQNSGFLLKVGNQYCLSPKIIRLADLVQSNLSICDVARPIIQAVVRKARETVTLNTRRNYERIVADVAPFQAPLMTMVRKGEHIPLLFGATSRILLAYLDESARAPVLQKMPRQVDRKQVELELSSISYARLRSDSRTKNKGVDQHRGSDLRCPRASGTLPSSDRPKCPDEGARAGTRRPYASSGTRALKKVCECNRIRAAPNRTNPYRRKRRTDVQCSLEVRRPARR